VEEAESVSDWATALPVKLTSKSSARIKFFMVSVSSLLIVFFQERATIQKVISLV
jgi:hypothetical protein